MKKFWIRIAILILIVELAMVGCILARGHFKLRPDSVIFTESSKNLKNPERGFYRIYGFYIRDNEKDYKMLVNEKLGNDTDTRLSMIQINLQDYRDGDISELGLKHIVELFGALEEIDK